jgi:hypothetical protein
MQYTNRPARAGFFMDCSMMFKRLFLALALAAGLIAPVHSAGTIPGFSLTQQFDNLGRPLAACQFYTVVAGTTSTPQNAYQDTALTLALPNPQTCDASGRLPQMFVADGLIKIRLTNAVGVTQVVADNILVIGPSGGGGGGGTVDPTTILTTGDLKVSYGTSVLTGFVRGNGRTIGSATSGATERANADTQALFVLLWTNDATLVVSTGRGVSAAADWAANKTIALPDYRGRALAGLDDMGSSAAGRLTAGFFGTAATVLGAAGGTESRTLSLAQLPTGITAAGSNAISVSGSNTINVTSTINVQQSGSSFAPNVVGGGANALPTFASSTVSSTGSNFISASGANSIAVTSNNTSGAAHATASPMKLATIYLKL